MDQALLSTISALSGTVIGGLTSFATSWMTQNSQARRQWMVAERNKREAIYVQFLDEISKVYALAVSEAELNYTNLVDIFALKGRIHMFASEPVMECADRSVKMLMGMYMAPNPTPEEVSARLEDIRNDPLREFAELCRAELQRFAT